MRAHTITISNIHLTLVTLYFIKRSLYVKNNIFKNAVIDIVAQIFIPIVFFKLFVCFFFILVTDVFYFVDFF